MVQEAYAEDAALPGWAIVGSDGKATGYASRNGWVAAWRRRVEAIEGAERPVPARRAALERMLAADGPVLRSMGRQGKAMAALDATALAAAADGRLAALAEGGAPPAAGE